MAIVYHQDNSTTTKPLGLPSGLHGNSQDVTLDITIDYVSPHPVYAAS